MTWRTNLLGEERVMTEGGCDNCEMTWVWRVQSIGGVLAVDSQAAKYYQHEAGEITKPCARGEVGPQNLKQKS